MRNHLFIIFVSQILANHLFLLGKKCKAGTSTYVNSLNFIKISIDTMMKRDKFCLYIIYNSEMQK